jgi:putative ATP-dependent endonuclease of OLD family
VRLRNVRIQSFRCIDELELDTGDLTVLVGANGSGKSSTLRALVWFFEGGQLEPEDVCGLDPDGTVSVSATFTDFSEADREALGRYAVGDTATFWRTWSRMDGEKLTGRGLAYLPFEAVRVHDKAMDLRRAYGELAGEHPELELPSVRSADAARDEMRSWEERNPEALEPATSSATHLFGFTGGPKLAGRFDFVFVPAVSDVAYETRDARGTLLRQLLDRSTPDQTRMHERLEDVERRVAEEVGTILEEENRDTLADVSERVTSELRRLVEGGSIALEVRPVQFRMPPVEVGMRVGEGGIETDVGRQGHGFQRALLIAIVQELSRVVEDGTNAPALFLAMEEPELYQHPVQARHFARVLADLPRDGAGGIQVAYATHSEHFVDPSRYELLRRFHKRIGGKPYPTATVTAATVGAVAKRLDGLIPGDQVAKRVAITLQRTLAEAVFARAVLLVEGRSDEGLLSGVADRDGGLDAAGVAVVSVHGKTVLAVAWAILTELGVPTYIVFDGDADLERRLLERGRDEQDVELAMAQAVQDNRNLLRLLGAAEEDWPSTAVTASYGVFRDTLETELLNLWPEMLEAAEARARASGDWRNKPEDCYREAAREAASDPPEFARDIIAAVRDLA